VRAAKRWSAEYSDVPGIGESIAKNIILEHDICDETARLPAVAHGISGPHFKARILRAATYVTGCVGRMTGLVAQGQS